MTASFKHKFVSPIPDGTNVNDVRPSNWNDEHDITMAAGRVLGRDITGFGPVQELPIAVDEWGKVGIGTSAPAGKLHVAIVPAFSWGAPWTDGAVAFGGGGLMDGALGFSYDDTYGGRIGAIQPGVSWKDIGFFANQLIFNTSGNIERMRLTTAGDLGIGTSGPGAQLHLMSRINDPGYTVPFVVQQPNGPDTYSILRVGQVSANQMFLEVSDQANVKGGLQLQPYGGKVGIGTVPNYDLDIREPANTTLHLMAYTSGVRAGISVDMPVSATGYFGTYSGHPAVFGTNNAERMRIDVGGSVGIGTSSPNAKLDVIGPAMQISASDGTVAQAVGYADGAIAYSGTISTHPYGIIVGSNEKMRFAVGGDASFLGTGALGLHHGTTAQRPAAPVAGMFRFNTETAGFEGYNGAAWASIAGGGSGGGIDQATADALYVNATGDTMTGNLTIAPTSGWSAINISKPTNSDVAMLMGMNAGKPRWSVDLGVDDAESGGNTGSTFSVDRYDDAGAYNGRVLGLDRATGAASFHGNFYVGSSGGDFGIDWRGLFTKNQDAPTNVGIINTTVGPSAACVLEMIGGTGNSYHAFALNDGNGAPYLTHDSGTGILFEAWNIGGAERMRLSPGGMAVNGNVEVAGNLILGAHGAEGGEINFRLGTDSTLAGGMLYFDQSGDDFRMFEGAGAFRQFHFDIANGRIFYDNGAAGTPGLFLKGTLDAAGAAYIPSGVTSSRPATPAAGYLRFNTTTSTFEGYNGTAWGALAGGAYLPLTGGTVTGTITASNFMLDAVRGLISSGNASTMIYFDANDYLLYDRLNNQYIFRTANADKFRIANDGSVETYGPITIVEPTVATHAASKQYVDAAVASGFRRNRIQNGAMQIDQRFSGAGLTVPNGSGAIGDRWGAARGAAQAVGAGIMSASPDATNAPLPYSLIYNVATGAAPAVTDYCGIYQYIEGADMADLRWGTAAAKPVTLSFSVYTPLAGLYAFRLVNTAQNRSYVGTFTVNAANTWQRIIAMLPGDTTGTWPIDGTRWGLAFDMGSGSNFNAPAAGVWGAGNFTRIAGTVNFAAAARAFYITAVQLEAGSIATPFEWRNIRDQLADCQRWYRKVYSVLTGAPYVAASTGFWENIVLSPPMRAVPAVALSNVGVVNAGAGILNAAYTTNVRIMATSVAAGLAYSIDDVSMDTEGV